MIKLLLVEDDTNLSYMVQSGLEDMIGGYEVITAQNGEEGYRLWKEQKPNVIVADIEMPIMNGFEMVKKIRETDGDTPIFFASALVAAKDVTKGYKMGVNSYVKKPYIPEELDAHIQALLKIKAGVRASNSERHYTIGQYVLDAEHATLKDITGNIKILTVREAHILELLCQHKHQTEKREAILSRFWDTEDDYFAGRSLDVFINKLRKALSGDPSVEIKTVRAVGYILITPQ